jgi:micrococcal nuclease
MNTGRISRRTLAVVAIAAFTTHCDTPSSCGPATGRVERVVDGDTILLGDGERVRYLLVDTPEASDQRTECFGEEAAKFNRDLVEGRAVTLAYDLECRDRHQRLLAYVAVDGLEVNAALVERGYACVLHIPPNGSDRVSELESLERTARREGRGLWGACADLPCGR